MRATSSGSNPPLMETSQPQRVWLVNAMPSQIGKLATNCFPAVRQLLSILPSMVFFCLYPPTKKPPSIQYPPMDDDQIEFLVDRVLKPGKQGAKAAHTKMEQKFEGD